ncbi:hypothetical protein G6F50_017343 [Rhizopus delemar]|uniref:Uncharacterized protein n=1 Tax=Rhizopus delemar TaxID=936053 RepID=A0A9P6XQW4_9FUNG|nr:hypothetical protein G6F50_017343 [Rhizopus delemar]
MATPATSHTHPGVPWLPLLRRAWLLPRRAAMSTASPDAYIFSGALTPRRSRPLASTWRAAQARVSLALRSAASSTSTGVP